MLSKAAIFAAVPGGSRRCRSQREWLRAALAEIEAQGWYANRTGHYSAICRALMRFMDWRDRTSRPGHAALAEAAGVSPDTVARAVRWLQDRGLAGLVSPGTTAAVRPGVLYLGTGNLAAVYVLTVPRRRSALPRRDGRPAEFADLSGSCKEPDKAPRTREAYPKVKPRSARAPRGLPLLPRGRPALHHRPENRSEGLSVAEAIRSRSRELARLSAEHVRSLARAFLAAGWTGADVIHALDHDQRGRQHGYTYGVRSPAGWARARLSAWLDDLGQPMPSRSQRAAADRERILAEQVRRRAERRPPSGYTAGAALARQLLAERMTRPSRLASPSRASWSAPLRPAALAAPPPLGRARPARGG